jgi:cell division protein FtsB
MKLSRDLALEEAAAVRSRCTALEQEKDEKAESANREQIAALEQELDQLEQEIKQLKANRAG